MSWRRVLDPRTEGFTEWVRLNLPGGGTPPPHLTESLNGNTFTITWTGGGTLQKSVNISSPVNWVTIPGAASPFVTNKTAVANQFFRVTVP